MPEIYDAGTMDPDEAAFGQPLSIGFRPLPL